MSDPSRPEPAHAGAPRIEGLDSSPPIDPLREIVECLAANGIECALGGSGLLAALGLESRVGDWDLTTDAPLEAVRTALECFGPSHVGPNGIHADNKLVLAGHETECIVRFSLRSGTGAVRIPTVVTGQWLGVPVGSPEAWMAAYALMGRREKADRLFGHLLVQGARRDVVDRLRAEALPTEVSGMLEALPVRP